jgi:hypothetical protein
MRPRTRWLIGLIGVLVLAFGLGCLNYTAAEGLEHHREAAARYNLPPPGPPIFLGGVASVVLGSAAIGFALGRSQSGRAA